MRRNSNCIIAKNNPPKNFRLVCLYKHRRQGILPPAFLLIVMLMQSLYAFLPSLR